MEIYELKLKPLSPWITDLTADTIFGHLCWQIKYEFLDEVLKEFLKKMTDTPIFTLSDILPADRLPRPLSNVDSNMGEQDLLDFKKNKKYKKVNLVTISDFKKYFLNKNIDLENINKAKQKLKENKLSYFNLNIENKNIINRNSGTTSEGGIYSQESKISTGLHFSLFIKIFDKEKFEEYKILKLLKEIFEITGFGKKKSTGKGLFEIKSINENFKQDFYGDKTDFKNILVLSNCIPSNHDTTKGNYKIFTKYPKMGETNSLEGTNFYKKPLVMIESGATFEKDDDYKGYVGKMIENVDFQKKGIYHYAYGFTLDF